MKEHLGVERTENQLHLIAELKSEGEFGSAEHFERELLHDVKIQKRVNLKEILNNDQS